MQFQLETSMQNRWFQRIQISNYWTRWKSATLATEVDAISMIWNFQSWNSQTWCSRKIPATEIDATSGSKSKFLKARLKDSGTEKQNYRWKKKASFANALRNPNRTAQVIINRTWFNQNRPTQCSRSFVKRIAHKLLMAARFSRKEVARFAAERTTFLFLYVLGISTKWE